MILSALVKYSTCISFPLNSCVNSSQIIMDGHNSGYEPDDDPKNPFPAHSQLSLQEISCFWP